MPHLVLTWLSQLIMMFKNTPLARCEDQWGAFDAIKQYLGNGVKNPEDDSDGNDDAPAAMDSEDD
jgi:hypothetical protein